MTTTGKLTNLTRMEQMNEESDGEYFIDELDFGDGAPDSRDRNTDGIGGDYWPMLLRTRDISRFNKEVAAIRHGYRPMICWSNLSGLDLRGAKLANAFLAGTDLTGSDLRGIDFTGANLEDVIFAGADLRGATGLTPEQLATATGLESAKLPDYISARPLASTAKE